MMNQDAIEESAISVMEHPRLLLVDDHEPNLMALREVLRRDDVDLLCAQSGVEALELLLDHDVALAIIDVQMPDMDGFELAELMRGAGRAKHVPIIFVTAGSRDAERRFRGYEAGAVDFLYKPLEPDVLKSKVNVFLALDRQRRDLARLLEQRTEAERRARESEARLQYALKATNDVVWDWDAVRDSQVWSQAGADLFGWTEIVDSPQNAAWWVDRIHPEDRERVAQGFHAVLEHATLFHWEDEYRFRRKDGGYAHVFDRGYVIRDARGKAVRMIGAMQDITARKEAEAWVKKSEQHFRKVTESLPQLVWTCRPDGSCDYLSPQWITYTGIPEAPQLGYDWLEQLHPDDRERVMTAWQAVAGRGEDFRIEFRIRRHDGVYRWFHTQAVALRDQNGAIAKWFGTNTDIQAIKEAEATLRESEERFRALADNIAQLAWMMDETGRVYWYNQRWYAYTGTTFEEVQGWGWQQVHHPDHVERVVASKRRSLDSGEPWEETFPLRGKDGAYRWFLTRAVPIRDEQGRLIRWFGTNTDVTEQRRTEQALQDQQQRLRYHVTNAGLAVIEWDSQWAVTRWEGEAERIFGWTQEEVLGKLLHDLNIVFNDDIPHVQGVMAQLCDGVTHTLVSHNRNYTKSGRVIHCAWHNSVLLDDSGRPSSVLSLVQDETAKIEAEAALQSLADRLEKTIEDRTRELSHSQAQLRALATDLNLSEQRERARLATELHDHLQQTLVLGKLTIGQGKRAAAGAPAYEQVLKKVDDLFSEALTYTRTLVSDLSPPVLRDHGLAAALQWLVDYMRKHELTVTVTVPEDREITLPDDQVMLLFQSVRELLINSAKYAGTGQATVALDRRDGSLTITVRDDGAGFDLAAAAAAAEIPSGGLSSKFGLLSIRERMRALGGTFAMDSAPGKGTTAVLSLPLVVSIERGNNMSARPSSFVSRVSHANDASRYTLPGHRIRVLLVDDHVMVRQGLRVVLDAYADVELIGEAGTGEEAIQLVDRLRPAVVVMDINMPKMDGIEATEQIKRRYPETIVIGISVNAAKENEESMIRAGAVRLMTKEAAVEQLYDEIQKAVKSG